MTRGKCLCGSIEVELDEAPKAFTVCHCQSCRQWSGGIFMSVNAGKDFSFSNEDSVGRFSSSEWAERGFCKQCGTHLFYRMKKSNHYFLMLGLFGDEISPKFEEQQFIDQKPDSYSFTQQTQCITSTEMMQMLQDFLSSN